MNTFQGQGVFKFTYVAEISAGSVLELITSNTTSINGQASFKVLQGGSLGFNSLKYPIWKKDEYGNFLLDENGNKIIDTAQTQKIAANDCLVEITETAHNLNCARGTIEVTGVTKTYSCTITPTRILGERELSNHTITAVSTDTENINLELTTTHSWINIIEKPDGVNVREWQNLSLYENNLLPRRGIVSAVATTESETYGTITIAYENIEIIQDGFEFRCIPPVRNVNGRPGTASWGISPAGVDIVSKTVSCPVAVNVKFLSNRKIRYDEFASMALWPGLVRAGITSRPITIEFTGESEDSYNVATGGSSFITTEVINQQLTGCPSVSNASLIPSADDDPKPDAYYLQSTGEVFIFNEETQTYESTGIVIEDYENDGPVGGSRTGTVTWTCEDGTKAVLTVTQEGDSQ